MSEGVIPAETATADAPPPSAPVVEAPAAPEVEAPSETGNWLMELAVSEGGEPAAEKTPLPAEAPAVSTASEPPAAEPPPATPVDEKAAPAVEVKPADADEELTPEENELVQSRPEAEQPELGRRLKTARFMSHYLDPEKPAEDIRQHLEQRSPSRYAELEQAVIEKKLANPAVWADETYAKSPELYGRVALEIFNGDPGFFIKHVTGKDFDAPTMKAAAEAYDPTKPAATTNGGPSTLTAEEMEDVRLYLGDELAQKIEAAAKAAPAPSDKPAEETAPPDLEKLAAEQKARFEAQQQAEAESDRVFSSGVKVIDDYFGSFADDAKAGLGLKVTAEERQLAPEVADLKDFKREVWLSGFGDLPAIEKGFGEWGKDNPEFNKLLGQAWHYADKKEEANTVAVAHALLPFADKYKNERLKHPLFARLDTLIKLASAQTNPKVQNDAIIPGAPANSQPQASGAEARIANYLLGDALSVK